MLEEGELNPGPAVCQSDALPQSHRAAAFEIEYSQLSI